MNGEDIFLSISKVFTESKVKQKSDMYSQQSRKEYKLYSLGKRKWCGLAAVKLGHGELVLEPSGGPGGGGGGPYLSLFVIMLAPATILS